MGCNPPYTNDNGGSGSEPPLLIPERGLSIFTEKKMRCRSAASSLFKYSICVQGLNDRFEVLGLQAGPAHQRAVDVGDVKDLRRIAGFDGTAVQNAH